MAERRIIMGVLRFNFRSESLSLSTDVTITYPSERFSYYGMEEPKREEGPFKRRPLEYQKGMKFQTVYMLHGGSDDDTSIIRRTNLERYAEENCVMTVTAQVKDSFFMDTQYGYKYFTYMTEELPKMVQTLFASSDRREDNFVLGVAMGGNGALAMAMKRPDLYAACVDLSGGVGCSIDTDYFIEELKTMDMQRLRSTFGPTENIRNSSYDLGYYARKNIEDKISVPKIYIGVGENDFIRDVVRKDRDALKQLGYNFSYEEAPGLGHDWDFWDLYIKKALYEWLPLKKKPLFE
jgi:putative tributyrin esterase